MAIPTIKIEYDLDKEVNKFLTFLDNPQFPHLRNSIFQAFPDLESQINKSHDKRKIIKQFIIDFRNKHRDTIEKITKESEKLIEEKSGSALETLAKLMDHEWSGPLVYKAILTILPFSPLDDNTFYFSVLGKIRGREDKDILYVAIHEISHFLFYDILKKVEDNTETIFLPNDVKNYLKESLTVVLLNQKPLCDILKLNNYRGNPEIRDLKIQRTDGSIIEFTNFIKEYYQNIKIKEKKTFEIFLQEIINITSSITEELLEKRIIWNRFGFTIFKNSEILKNYQCPIKIKG